MKSLIFVLLVVLNGCGSLSPSKEGTHPVDHEPFSALLSKHVSAEGLVNYRGFISDSLELKAYLKNLTNNPPNNTNWSQEEQIAYWINLYNAATIALVLKYYPIESIKDIGSGIQVPFVNTPWDIQFLEIAGTKYDLNNIEHNILRKNWEEPRIHFAINCASLSCPKLRREAYTAGKLESQLEEQAVAFINDDFRNSIAAEQAELSKIFSWFSGDFEKQASLVTFINRYAKVKMNESVSLSYKDYNWTINDQK